MRKVKRFLIVPMIMLMTISNAANEKIKSESSSLGPCGEIRSWLVLGPIPLPFSENLSSKESVGKGFDNDFLKVAGGEKNIKPVGGETLFLPSGKYKWMTLNSKFPKMNLFVFPDGKVGEKMICYCYTILNSSVEQNVLLSIGSDDSCKVYYNGELIHTFKGQRSVRIDSDIIPIHLKKGKNTLLVRVDNYVSTGGLAARLLTTEHLPVKYVNTVINKSETTEKFPLPASKTLKEYIAELPGKLLPAKNQHLFGGRITRTMSLLATGAITKRPVRIAFYGQSIVAQPWTEHVISELRRRFPKTEIIYFKPAIGGYTAPNLIKTLKHDIFRTSPDLLVFHVYGGERGEFERIIQNVRRETTADIMMFSHHLSKRDAGILKSPDKIDTEEYSDPIFNNIARVAQKYDCEFVNVRQEWKDYILKCRSDGKSDMKVEDFLVDAVHLNRTGRILMAAMVERHFRINTLYSSNWDKRVRCYFAPRFFDEGRKDEIIYHGTGWKVKRGLQKVYSSSKDDYATLKFKGNRVDLVLPSDSGSVELLIDGEKPSTLNLFHATRPRSPSKHSNVQRVICGDNMQEEAWTLTFTDFKMNEAADRVLSYKYKLEGSVTGSDGTGDNTGLFISNSGRIKIAPEDIILSVRYAKKFIKPGLQVKWVMVPDFYDVISPNPADMTKKYIVAVDGLENKEHTLTLRPVGDKPFAMYAIEVHCPPFP